MTVATLDMKKAPREVQLADAVIPTPTQETKMLDTLHPAPNTVSAPDWRDLLDDPEVLRIVRIEAARFRHRAYDPLLRDEAESYLLVAAVQTAKDYSRKIDHQAVLNRRAHWYTFLAGGLRASLSGIVRACYGHDAHQARFERSLHSIEALSERATGGTGELAVEAVRGVDLPRYSSPRSENARRALAFAGTRESFDAEDIALTLGITARAARKIIQSGLSAGRYYRLARGRYGVKASHLVRAAA